MKTLENGQANHTKVNNQQFKNEQIMLGKISIFPDYQSIINGDKKDKTMSTDLQKSLKRAHINPSSLSTFQRILLTTTSSLTLFPTELMNYIDMAENNTLPDPLADPDILTIWVAGGRISFINTVADNGNQFTAFDLFVPPDNGPPLHFHTRETEWFYVIDGNPNFQLDNQFIPGEEGTLIFSLVEQLHAYKNTTSESARMILFYEPKPGDDPDSIGNIGCNRSAISDPKANAQNKVFVL